MAVWFTGLARVARKTGYPVVEVPGWKTRGHGPMQGCKTIVPHHTAGAKTGNYPSLAVVRDGRESLPGPLSQYGLGRDGTIYVIAAGRCWHAGRVAEEAHSNDWAIGIEAENTGRGEPWTERQLDAYVKLCRELVDEFRLDADDVRAHKEIAIPRGRKPDPAGIDMDTFRSRVRAGSWAGDADVVPAAVVKPKPTPAKPKPQPKPKPKPKPKAWPDAALPVTRKHTAASHDAWVRLMDAIGYDDRDLGLALQKWLRGLGFYTTDYLLDGKFGPASVKALQRFLKSKRLYRRAIDGARGRRTVAAEIAYLNDQRRYVK